MKLSIYCLFYFHMIENKPITAFSDNLTVFKKTYIWTIECFLNVPMSVKTKMCVCD